MASTVEISSLLVQPYMFLMWFNDKSAQWHPRELVFEVRINAFENVKFY